MATTAVLDYPRNICQHGAKLPATGQKLKAPSAMALGVYDIMTISRKKKGDLPTPGCCDEFTMSGGAGAEHCSLAISE